jgi:hypothetical protein
VGCSAVGVPWTLTLEELALTKDSRLENYATLAKIRCDRATL